MRDEVIELPDVDSSIQVDLDVAGPGPQFEFGIEVEHAPRVLGGPHVDRVVGKGVDLDFLPGETLRVSDDEALGGEDRGVTERLVRGDRLFTLDE